MPRCRSPATCSATASVIRFEIPTKHGALRGTLTRVSGELNVDLSDLTRSRGLVRAELGSLDIHANGGTEIRDSALLERARAALSLSPDGATRQPCLPASTSPPSKTPCPHRSNRLPSATRALCLVAAGERDRGRARFTAVGNLLLHGFRVARRAPLEAEFGFTEDRSVPSSVLIRSRSPFVISLETHAIVALANESRASGPGAAQAQAREVRVSVELYGTKID